jgi:hypothetical protein
MMDLVDARVRKPVKFGMYWVRCDGNRKMLALHEFDHALLYYNEVLWVEEERDKFTEAKPKPVFEFKQDIIEVEPDINQIKPVERRAPIPLTAEERVAVNTIVEIQQTKIKTAFQKKYYKTRKAKLEKVELQPKVVAEPVLLTTPTEKIVVKPNFLTAREKEVLRRSKKREAALAKAAEVYTTSLLTREYGDYEDVKRCSYKNSRCPLAEGDGLAFLKFQERERLIYLVADCDHTYIKPYWNSYRLATVKHIYPQLNGCLEIPSTLLTEMEWVYGASGVGVINKKLLQSYKSKNNVTNS